jgi:histidyl-tRNA synthetase
MAQTTGIPKGTRDFGPDVMQKREYIFETIKGVFRLFGYQPIETPSMENLSVLLGKYGEEGDKLIYRILNSGDFFSAVPETLRNSFPDNKNILQFIAEKGLRYDLTVPFARFVVMNRHEIQFPFKRYQIQPVWRADRPQKGRYREFYQCDADVIGSGSMLNEFELVQIIEMIFSKLNLHVTVHINNRKILDGILNVLNISGRLNDVAVAIDKLDKTDESVVISELTGKGMSVESVMQLLDIIRLKGDPASVLEKVTPLLLHDEAGATGISELTELNDYLSASDLKTKVIYDLSLARGLDYYTGAIFEVKADDVKMGSICGGGRYDNLTEFFGLPDMSGVGISFGADRIYDVLNELMLFPENIETSVKVLLLNFGRKETEYQLSLLSKLRNENIPVELYPDADKIKKQMNYANRKNIPFVIMAGEEEIGKNVFTLKNMQSGAQNTLTADELIGFLKKTV